MRLRFIDDAGAEFHRLWCIRFSIWFAVFTAVAGCISLFGDLFNPWFLLGLAIVVNLVLIPLARLVQQEKPAPVEPKGGEA